MDVGVCNHKLDNSATLLHDALNRSLDDALALRYDEPYAGTHPGAHIGRKYHARGARTVTLEICNDLIDTENKRSKIFPALKSALEKVCSRELCNA